MNITFFQQHRRSISGLVLVHHAAAAVAYTLLCIGVLLSAFSPAQAEETRITRVEIEGNSRIEDSTVLLQVNSETGSLLNPQTVERDIRQIFGTGFFEQVVAKTRFAPGGVELVFVVVEKPAIREIKIEGNDEVTAETIKEKLNISARRFLDRRKISLGIEEVKRYYQTQGFYGTDVELSVIPVQENQVDLTFKIDEGEEKVIRKVSFEGNSVFDDDDLRDVVSTRRYKWWNSWITGTGVVKEEELKNDVRALTHHYLTNGHVDVKVTEPKVEEVEDGLKVVFPVSEGAVYEFGSISAEGTLLDNSVKKTLEGIKSSQGKVFNVDHLREDTFIISEKFTDIGYAFANVDPLTNVDRANRKVDLLFKVDKGELITVRRINITGNAKTRDNVIRRSLKIEEQQLFSSSRIKRSQELLQRLGYFDEVTITPEPAQLANQVDLGVSVREGQTGTFSIGAGISSGDGFIASTRISENNIFGTGNSIAIDINTGSRRENYVLSFNNPRVNDSRLSMGIDLLSVNREFDDFERKQAGGSLEFGYPLWIFGPDAEDDIRATIGYELLNINIDKVEKNASQLVRDASGKSVSSSVTPGIVRNTIDNPLDPTKGSRQSFKVEFAGIGGDEEFWLTQATNTWYYPLFDTPIGLFVFSQRLNFGYGETFNNEDFPLFRRFFPGGINSVRGYEARELGPKDEEGNEFGGSKQLVANFEMIFPLVTAIGLKGVVFYDIGNAFDDEEDIEFSELRQAIGWGFRWRSPLAPIRVEIGYPLDKEDGDKSVVTNFSFGSPL